MGTKLLTTKEAAKLLGVTKSMVYHMTRSGLLTAAARGKGTLYKEEDIYAVLQARNEQMDLPKIAILALQARSQIASLEKRVEELYELLGAEYFSLKVDAASVADLHLTVRAALKNEADLTSDQLKKWAKIFKAIDEKYLKIVNSCTASSTPWLPYLRLANKLVIAAAEAGFGMDYNMRFVLAQLIAARDSLRATSYTYARSALGYKKANELFPKTECDDIILAHIN